MKKTGSLDSFRFLACFLVVSIHTSIFSSYNANLDFVFTRILARVAVPFFLMVTGYFSLKEDAPKQKLHHILIKVLKEYGWLILLYLPLNLYAKHFANFQAIDYCKAILIDGTFYHLWYFPSLFIGVLITWYLMKFFQDKAVFWITVCLYLIGLGGDSYYGIVSNIPNLKQFYDGIFLVFQYTRNGIFYMPLFLFLGSYLSKSRLMKQKASLSLFLISMALMIAEGLLLHQYGLQRHDSMYIFLPFVMVSLFSFLLTLDVKPSLSKRYYSRVIYYIHPWMIVVVRFFAKAIHQTPLLVQQSLVFYVLVCVLSYVFAKVAYRIHERGAVCKEHGLKLAKNA